MPHTRWKDRQTWRWNIYLDMVIKLIQNYFGKITNRKRESMFKICCFYYFHYVGKTTAPSVSLILKYKSVSSLLFVTHSHLDVRKTNGQEVKTKRFFFFLSRETNFVGIALHLFKFSDPQSWSNHRSGNLATAAALTKIKKKITFAGTKIKEVFSAEMNQSF